MSNTHLLDVAIREFSAKGLDGASTRAIAKAANASMSAITYHYGGKEGLYLAAAVQIAAYLRLETGAMFDAESAIATNDPSAARESLHGIVSNLFDKMASDEIRNWSLFIIREQLAPTNAFDRLYEGVIGQILRTMVGLACVASRSRDLRAAQILTLTLFGQVLILRSSRAMSLRLLGRKNSSTAKTSTTLKLSCAQIRTR